VQGSATHANSKVYSRYLSPIYLVRDVVTFKWYARNVHVKRVRITHSLYAVYYSGVEILVKTGRYYLIILFDKFNVTACVRVVLSQ